MSTPNPALFVFLALALLGCGGESDSRRHVLLITMDTTRFDRLSAYGYPRPTSPKLEALAKRGIRFDKAYSSNPVTLPSHTTMLTGTYPFYHGVRDNGLYRVPQDCVTLAERLQVRNYRTAAFVAAAVMSRDFELDQGFDHYDAELPTSFQPTGHFSERAADKITDLTLEWVDQNDDGTKPFFLWTHYFDPHAPWQSPEPHRTRLADSSVEYADYDAEIAFMDAEIGRLLDGLEARGQLENTLVIAVADHGEGLLDHGELTHGLFVYDETIRVPLIIAGPGVESGKVDNQVARTVDIVPTVLDHLGFAPSGDEPLHGGSLFDENRSQDSPIAYFESYTPQTLFGWSWLEAVRSEDRKFIDSPIPEVYDLTKDPGEKNNLFELDSAESNSMISALKEEKGRTLPPGESGYRASLEASGELQAQLIALGYAAGALDPNLDGEPQERGPDLKNTASLLLKKEEGTTLMNAGRYEEAEALFEDLLDELPRRGIAEEMLALTHSHRARLLFERGDREAATSALRKAITHFEAQLQENPRYVLGHYNIAMAADKIGDRDSYRERLQVCLDIDPDFLPGLYYLGVLSFDERKYEKALELLDAMLAKWRPADPEAEPQGADAWLKTAICLHRKDRDEEASSRLLKAERLLPDWPAPLYWRGQFAFENNDFQSAKKHLSAYTRSPSTDPILVRRAQSTLKRIERR